MRMAWGSNGNDLKKNSKRLFDIIMPLEEFFFSFLLTIQGKSSRSLPFKSR